MMTVDTKQDEGTLRFFFALTPWQRFYGKTSHILMVPSLFKTHADKHPECTDTTEKDKQPVAAQKRTHTTSLVSTTHLHLVNTKFTK